MNILFDEGRMTDQEFIELRRNAKALSDLKTDIIDVQGYYGRRNLRPGVVSRRWLAIPKYGINTAALHDTVESIVDSYRFFLDIRRQGVDPLSELWAVQSLQDDIIEYYNLFRPLIQTG
jgi:hypothetical protein